MHVKHYHPEFNSIVGNRWGNNIYFFGSNYFMFVSPSVTDLAFHRTRLGEDFKVS